MTFLLKIQDTAGTVIDFLTASTGYSLEEEGLQIPPPKKKQKKSGPIVGLHGNRLTSTRYQNRINTINFRVTGATRDEINQRVVILNQLLERVRLANEGEDRTYSAEMAFQLSSSGGITYFRILGGEFNFPSFLMSAKGTHWESDGEFMMNECALKITCEPFVYGSSTLLTWEDSGSESPQEVSLSNINSTTPTTGGLQVDNHYDSNDQNFVQLLASEVPSDTQMPTITILENTSPDYEDLGKVYIGAAPGAYYFTLNGAIDDSQVTMVVNEQVHHFNTPLKMKMISGEVVEITAKNNVTKTLTITRGADSSTPSAQADASLIELISVNPLLDSDDADFSGVDGGDASTNRVDVGSSGGSYEEVSITDSGVREIAKWTLDQDVVAAQEGIVRVLGRFASAIPAGQSSGNYWSVDVNYRLRFTYLGRSASERDIHVTEWKSPVSTTIQLFDFGAIRLPPTGFFKDNISAINVILECEIKPDASAQPYFHNIDFLYLLPVTNGYRVMETRNESLARGDKIVDDGWLNVLYAEQIASYPSGVSLGKAGIVNGFMSPLWLQPNQDQRIFFLQESVSGLTNIDRRFDVSLYVVPTYLNIVHY